MSTRLEEPRTVARAARILAVDDEAANRRLLRDILTPLGYEVWEAGDGQEALEVCALDLPDLVLLDVVMPRLDGYSVCKRLKEDPRTKLIPVVILTSLDQLTDKLAAIEVGADDFLSKPFNVTELTTRVRSLIALKRYTDELEHVSTVLLGIAMIAEKRDAYTGEHCKRVGESSVRLGMAFGLNDHELKALRHGGTFHDLGKIAIPDSILRKPGRLTFEEMDLLKTHAVIGAELVQPMRTLESVIPLIRNHHEHLDGSGYPAGLSGEEITLPVRILSVVDIYDALATERPYKKAFPHDQCLAILRQEAKHSWWDEEVVETLARLLAGGSS